MIQLFAKYLFILTFALCHGPVAASAPTSSLEESPRWSVSFHEDAQGQLTISEVAALPEKAFMDLKGGPLRLGFTSSAIWLRVAVSNDLALNRDYWLELSSPLLEHVRFFAPNGQTWEEIPDKLSTRKPVFKIQTAPKSNGIYYIRIMTRTSMSTQVSIWDPEVYLAHENKISMNWSLMYGAYISMAVLFFAFWLWSKEKIHLIYSMYIAINFLAAFMTEGWPFLILETKKAFYVNTLGVLISLVILIGTVFTFAYLQTKRHLPMTHKVMLTITIGISMTCITIIATGDYQSATITAQMSSIMIIFINMLIALHSITKVPHRAKFFIIAFTPFYFAVIWRYMRNINAIEPSFLNDNAYQFGAFFHMILMSFGIFASYTRLRNERNQAQARADAEKLQREQQADFMTMVSHETRTPLAVILASAENSLLDSGLTIKTHDRLKKIVKAADRIQNLLTQFISREREISTRKEAHFKRSNLVRVAENQVHESQLLHEAQINLEKKSQEIHLSFDAELIRIALANLIENALYHSKDQNSVDVSIGVEDNEALIMVSDQGPGFTDEELAHVLSRYYRGKNSKGFGLGLYLVNQIAQEHSGRISITNRPGEGSDVRLYLPIHDRPDSNKPNVTGK